MHTSIHKLVGGLVGAVVLGVLLLVVLASLMAGASIFLAGTGSRSNCTERAYFNYSWEKPEDQGHGYDNWDWPTGLEQCRDCKEWTCYAHLIRHNDGTYHCSKCLGY